MADPTNLSDQQFLSQDPEVLGLQRQTALANLLTGQAFNAPQGQMISGHYVKPSALQQALPMINAAIGGITNANLDTKTQELAAALRGKQQEAMQNYVKASQGTPAQMYPQQAGPMPNGGNIPQQVQTPATGPNYGEMFKAGTSQYASPQLQAAAYKLLEPITTKEGETVTQRNLGAGGGMSTIATGAEKKSEAIRGYEMAKSQGFPGSFFDYEQQLKRAGASNVSVSMDKGIAAQVGPMMKEGQLQATSAVKGIDAANQVINALDTNKLFTGPLANQKLSIAQLGTTFGGASGDLTQKINNTRAAIQGLAEITLQGRQEMHGQGAITESEGKLAERAKSGDISLTPGELKQLANAAKRAGEFTYNNYQTKLQIMAKDPATAQMAPYFAVNQMPARQAPQQVQQVQPNANQQLNIPSANGWSVIGVK